MEEGDLLMETILIPIFICSYVITVIRITFSKLGKFYSQDSKLVLWLLVQTFYPMQSIKLSTPYSVEYEELYSYSVGLQFYTSNTTASIITYK